jgi:hypothetical protein
MADGRWQWKNRNGEINQKTSAREATVRKQSGGEGAPKGAVEVGDLNSVLIPSIQCWLSVLVAACNNPNFSSRTAPSRDVLS